MKVSCLLLPAVASCIFCLPSAILAQQRVQISNGCAYDTRVENTAPFTFPADPQAQQIVQEICTAIGIQQKFFVQSADVKNALACLQGNDRYILYNPNFLQEFQADARTKWAAYGVLAHEIGHHVNFHNFTEKDVARCKEMELEADRFSGSVLRLLGATYEEAKSDVEAIKEKAETETHPPVSARRLAVSNGWLEQDARLKKMGVTGVNDPNPNAAPLVRDSDGDGIPDASDACPDLPGDALQNGCPDTDQDGIADPDDKCRYKRGPAKWQGCPDSDTDGIPDHEDACPFARGELKDKGCPPADTDQDGLPDRSDRCPQQAGPQQLGGCPDKDGDGVPDIDDKCPLEKGEMRYDGCKSPPKASPGKVTEANAAAAKEDFVRSNMVFVKGGTFTMGDQEGRDDGWGNKPAHAVTLSDFYISRYEVTQAEWVKIMGYDNSNFKGCDSCPEEQVSWDDVQEFLKKLNALTGKQYRLPTEAEWEYAARGGEGGTDGIYTKGKDNEIDEIAWHSRSRKKGPQPVGGKKPNGLGLYDMFGNVGEWCSDWDHEYSPLPQTNPQGFPSGTKRIYRGGSWYSDPWGCNAARRLSFTPDTRYYYVGFRIAASSL